MEPRQVLHYLQRIPMFRGLGEDGERELLRLVPYARTRTYSPGERLLSETLAPDRTIILVSGRVDLRKSFEHSDGPHGAQRELRELGQEGRGAVLGRKSLVAGDSERLTVVAAEETETLFLLFRDLIRAYQGSDYLREHLDSPLKPESLTTTLQTVPLFSRLTDRVGILELYQIAPIVHEQYYDDNEWLFRQGEVSDRLIKVLEGQLELSLVDAAGIERHVGIVEPGVVMGETGLLVGDFHDVTAAAKGYARVLYILRSEFADLLSKRPYLMRQLSISDPVTRLRRLRQFKWLRDDEWVIEVAQRHWTRLLKQIAVPAFVLPLLLPSAVMLILSGQVALVALGVLLGVLLLVIALGIGWQYLNWLDDYFVITTQRVVHIERIWPLSTNLEEAPLHNIENIYEVQPSFIANVLNYGTLILQTAGETVNIDMSAIPTPTVMRGLISRQVDRTRARDVLRTRGQVRDMLSRRLDAQGAPLPSSPVSRSEPAPVATPSSAMVVGGVLTSIRDFLFPPSSVKLNEGNTIIWRRYWLPGMRQYGLPLLAFLVGTLGGIAFLRTRIVNPAFVEWLVGWLLLEAILLGVLFWYVADWRNDFFELTPTHVIWIERLPLLLRESRHEARLDRIQNLSYAVPSIYARIFRYGHVQFETAGTEGRFVLHYVRHPGEVQSTISNHQYEYRQRQREAEANQRQQELLTWFSTYDELHRETRQP